MPPDDQSPQGLEMLFALAYRCYDLQMDAFRAIDQKAGSLVGYITVAASLTGILSVRYQQALQGRWLVLVVFACFAVAAVLTLLVQSARRAAIPPSASEAFGRWEADGEVVTARLIVDGIQQAHDELRAQVRKKARLLNAAMWLAVAGFMALGIAVGQVVGARGG